MVRAETYASKWAFPRKKLLQQLHPGISQSSQRGCWWWNESLPLFWCPATLQPNILWGSPPLFTYLFLPAAPLSLDFALEIGLKHQFCSIFVMGKFFMGFCQASLHRALAYIIWGGTPCSASKHFSRDHISFSYMSFCAVLVKAKLSGNWQQTQKLFPCLSCYLQKLHPCVRLSQAIEILLNSWEALGRAETLLFPVALVC